MKHYILAKIILCYFAAAFVMFTILNTFGTYRYEQNLIQTKLSFMYNEAYQISSELNSLYHNQFSVSNNVTSQIKAIGNLLDTRIWIVNKDGDIISDTAKKTNSTSEFINVYQVNSDFLDSTFSRHTVMDSILSEPMISVVYPVNYQYQVQGYIVMHYSKNAIHTESQAFIDIINLGFLVFLCFLCLVFSYLYYLTIHPLRKLNKAALEYTRGNYGYKFTFRRIDEYGELANSLKYMAGELTNLDDYQKKFVANISHDFRSPLTSIKGFAEALQDGTIPYEMKDKYLGIILFETERLNKLTTGLLALNSFENHGTILDISSFDIHTIIKKTAESFEGICTNKKITLNLVFFTKEVFVDADMGRIQQVLYNLLDNAIKFSHNNSIIKITTTEKGDKIFVSIKDNGIGIPKDSVKKVWERFYKSDTSRGKDKKGTGLGLSITKEIINAHSENINVISTEGVGTEFIFSLSRSKDDL